MECLKAWLSCTSCLSQLARQSIQTANHDYIWPWLGGYFGNCASIMNKLYWRDHTLCGWWNEDHRNNPSYTMMTSVLKKKKKSDNQKSFYKDSLTTSYFSLQTFCLTAFPFPFASHFFLPYSEKLLPFPPVLKLLLASRCPRACPLGTALAFSRLLPC